MSLYDIGIIGAGPGGLACAIHARRLGLRFVIIEKGNRLLQGIIDSYPKGKKVYPTIPRGETDPFPIDELTPDSKKVPVEQYVEEIEQNVAQLGIEVRLGEDFQTLEKEGETFLIVTRQGQYRAKTVVLAFGSNIPIDLGVYGEAKTIARTLDNPREHIGYPTLVLGGGNAAADVVASLSKAKRAANDTTPIYWGNRKVQFKVKKEAARDLGEEILVGGQIRILQGAIPRIGEVDEDGVDRLTIMRKQFDAGGVIYKQAMSFQMKHVIACIGTQGPAPVFEKLGLQQITCTEGVCKIGKEGSQLIILSPDFQTSIKGIYAIGGAISPAYIQIQEEGSFKELKHSNIIYTAIKDAVKAVDHIARQMGSKQIEG
jgi:thioredoxin reductase